MCCLWTSLSLWDICETYDAVMSKFRITKHRSSMIQCYLLLILLILLWLWLRLLISIWVLLSDMPQIFDKLLMISILINRLLIFGTFTNLNMCDEAFLCDDCQLIGWMFKTSVWTTINFIKSISYGQVWLILDFIIFCRERNYFSW